MWLFLFHIFSYDIVFYATHILLHTPMFYWIHKKHHEKSEPTFLDTYYGHWLESPIQSVGFVVPFMFLEFDSMQTVCALMIVNARGILRHDPRGSFITGDHHLIHHKIPNCNYGDYWIDYLMNTHYKTIKLK
jgi:sterol desaturase/sphingolipid hydroxylase (fatty acid hydroxylase superfamily)